MKKGIAALLMVVGFMLATAAPAALAQSEGFDQGVGGSGPSPGRTKGSDANTSTPPHSRPGTNRRDSSANIHDTSDQRTEFGKRVDEQKT
jgi:hypothetical protein